MNMTRSKSARSIYAKLLCAVCLVLLVSACGGNGSSNGGNDDCPPNEERCEARRGL
ncbi:MAG: hypothetical protein AAFZ17_02635 [Cyanobacteria bacterium J06650_10]